VPLLIAELALGKSGAADAVTAFERPAPRSAWRHAGWLGVAGAVLILSYYSAIAGWALRYFVAAGAGVLWEAAGAGYGGYFARFIANPGEPLGWQLAMMLATMFVVMGGVRAGIERINLVLMPLLALIVLVLAGYALTLPGGGRGVAFLFAPDWGRVLDPAVLLAALGQAFFSIGLGVAVFVTYGSYMPGGFSVARSAAAVVAGDTLFALVAGLAIFPAVFAFAGNPAAGPELAFVTLPQIFLAMPGGRAVGTVFFFLLSAAALTSMISLLEVPVATALHRFGWRRWRAVAVCGGAIWLLGLPAGMSHGLLGHVRIGGMPVLDAMDHAVSNIVLPLSGMAVALFMAYVLPRHGRVNLPELRARPARRAFLGVLRVIPFAIAAMMVFRLFG
jgi:NSS family neurotransmitter:Na+ symporter